MKISLTQTGRKPIATFLATGLLIVICAGGSAPVAAAEPTQDNWHFCDKCYTLFFNGSPDKGRCAAGGGHNAQGLNFILPYGDTLTETPKAQTAWRFCGKCHEMFYDGFPDKGRCPAGGGHSSFGFRFRLPHDVGLPANSQGDWRFCGKCHAMFYDGNAANKGRCPAGGGHAAHGYTFALSHAGFSDLHLHADVRTRGWAPIEGWVDLVARENGDYVFSGHVHNSGGVNIRYTLAAVLVTPSGQSFGFGVNDHKVDGTQTIIDRERNDNWKQAKNDPRIAQNWNQVTQGTLHWRLVASDTVTSGLEKFMETVANEALYGKHNPEAKVAIGRAYLNLLLVL